VDLELISVTYVWKVLKVPLVRSESGAGARVKLLKLAASGSEIRRDQFGVGAQLEA
jgi:hypothetical protein